MAVATTKQSGLMRANGYESQQWSMFPEDFGVPIEMSPRRRRIARALWGLAGAAATVVISVPLYFPHLLPDFRSSQATAAEENGIMPQLNRCRFDDEPCVRIEGLVAVKTDDSNTGPAIRNPVVMKVEGEITVVSNNLAVEGDREPRFVEWIADENLALCRGDTEPEAQIVKLGNNPNTFGYHDPTTGSYSAQLETFASDCLHRVELGTLDRAMELLQ